jgi:hypothetical protein
MTRYDDVDREALHDWLDERELYDDDCLCLWCGEPLRFGPPWMHRYDGSTVRVRVDNGRQVDDHVALPDRRRER